MWQIWENNWCSNYFSSYKHKASSSEDIGHDPNSADKSRHISQKTNAENPKSEDKCRDSNSSWKQKIYMAIEFIYNIFALLEYKNLLVQALETGGQACFAVSANKFYFYHQCA